MLLFCAGTCPADTFVHRNGGESLHGYATDQTLGRTTLVQTTEHGGQYLDLAAYNIIPNRLGRNSIVVVIAIEESLTLEIETEAIENAIAQAANRGPFFIILQIDTPGGRVDYAKRICAAITTNTNCPIVAYINGGKHGGAFSAGAAIALACRQIFISPHAAIGAATATAQTASGPEQLEKAFGEVIGEKISSAWRGYLAALAEQNSRPGLVAMAMVDKDIEVIEVNQNGTRLFVEPANKKPSQKIVRSWSKKDMLVTLTANDAVGCMIADKIVASKEQLLRELDAESATIMYDNAPQEARKTYQKVMARFDKLTTSLDYNRKQLKQTQVRSKQLAILRRIIDNYKDLIHVAKNYPDVPVSVNLLNRQLNSAQAVYNAGRTNR